MSVCLKEKEISEQLLRNRLVYIEKSGFDVIISLWCGYDHYCIKVKG